MKKEDYRQKIFGLLGTVSYKYYWIIILLAIVTTLILGFFATKLRLEMSWLSIAPQNSEPVKQFKKIFRNFRGSTPIIIAVNGGNPRQLERVAGEISADLMSLKNEIKDVNYKVDRNFIRKHGLMLQKTADIKRLNGILSDFNLPEFYGAVNADFEKEYVQESDEPLARQEKKAEQSLDGLKEVLYAYNSYLKSPVTGGTILNKAIDRFSFGNEYFLSHDKKMILIFAQPYASVMDYDKIVPVVRKTEDILNKYREKYKGMTFGQTGMPVIARDEIFNATHDTYFNIITALIAIFLLLALSFRMFSAPILAMISLVLGIIWDLGISYIFIGRLNLMTALVGVLLIGLGIDYSIHIITGFTQNRFKGLSLSESLNGMYQKVGPGILTGALTTAVAFFAFMISGIDLMRELGFVMGVGILATFLSAIFVLPALIVAKEKMQKSLGMPLKTKKIKTGYGYTDTLIKKVVGKPYIVIFVFLIITILSLLLLPKLHFISDLRHFEARGLISMDLMDEIANKFDMSTDPVVFTTQSLKAAEDKTDELLKLNSVGFVNSISRYLPSRGKQMRRIPVIKKLKAVLSAQPALRSVDKAKLVGELRRLKDNVIEIGDMSYMAGLDRLVKRSDELVGLKGGKKVGKSIFDELIGRINAAPEQELNTMQKIFAARLRENFIQMANPEYITLADIPANIKRLLVSNDGKQYLINVYSAKPLWKNLFRSPFLKQVRAIEPKITGVAPLMYEVIKSAAIGGKRATILAFIAIFLLVLLDFRNLKFTFISLVPLVIGSIWVLGFLVISGFNFTWMTIMIVPLIIGIGIDDGVHIIHRYRIEGEGSLALVFKTTGKAIVLTSVTTMIAFGSLSFSRMVGYQEFGIALFAGIGLLLIMSMLLLPAILVLFEKKKK